MPVFNYFAGRGFTINDGSDVMYYREYSCDNIDPDMLTGLLAAPAIGPVEKIFLNLIKNNLAYINKYSFSDAHKYHCTIELNNGQIAEFRLQRCPNAVPRHPNLTNKSIEKDLQGLI